ncbi:hypothetical protein ABH966_004910 [Lysinibacillus sp. RC46]
MFSLGGTEMEKNIAMIHTLAIGMPKELHYSNGRSMITGIEKKKYKKYICPFVDLRGTM